MVRRMASPNGISACALAQENSVPRQSLSRWPSVADESVTTPISGALVTKMTMVRPKASRREAQDRHRGGDTRGPGWCLSASQRHSLGPAIRVAEYDAYGP